MRTEKIEIELFEEDDVVSHSLFGVGVVTENEFNPGRCERLDIGRKITVRFSEVPKKAPIALLQQIVTAEMCSYIGRAAEFEHVRGESGACKFCGTFEWMYNLCFARVVNRTSLMAEPQEGGE